MSDFRVNTIPELPGLAGYLEDISSKFCPFLAPSTKQSLVTYTVYDLEATAADDVAEAIFYLGLLHTEVLRRHRASLTKRQRILVCENLLFRFSAEDEVDGKALFAWPHWLLKVHYTAAGVLFGKFWKGEEADSRSGMPVPPPPYHLLSIRSAVKPRDPGFFTKAPELLDSLLAAEDDGQRVFDDADVDEVFYNTVHSPGETIDDFVLAYRKLQQTGLYQRLLAEARKGFS